MLSEIIKKIVIREDLSTEEAEEAMSAIMSGKSTDSQIAAFLIGLKMKGETIDEITGCARAMKYSAIPFEIEDLKGKQGSKQYAIDTCGTGGDGGKTFNISTAVAIVAAAAGIKVIKHGNRAVSGVSGSADVLKEMGVDIEMDALTAKSCFDKSGMTFLFAPKFHAAMKNAAPIRKELGTRTIFNILGPLTNPAEISGQVLGVFDANLTHTIAEVLLRLGRERALVVHGIDGLDEISTTTYTRVSEVREGRVIDYIINPEDYGISLSSLESIGGGDAKLNSEIIFSVFKGEEGPRRDIVVLNSAAALYVGKAVNSIKEGVQLAKEFIDSGKVYKKAIEIAASSQRCKI